MKTSQFLPVVLLATAAVFSVTAHAQEMPATAQARAATADMTDGEIRKINKDTQKITIKHSEIKNLDMPGMTMVFQVKDSAMLKQVKVGDKVKFVAEKSGGALVVTDNQPVK
jgi:Cu(I)/Ag(I) efflux system protein CusF